MNEIHIHYLEEQYRQTHSNMLVMRGAHQIQSVYSECKRVEHIQYPGLWVASMELQALEWISSQMYPLNEYVRRATLTGVTMRSTRRNSVCNQD